MEAPTSQTHARKVLLGLASRAWLFKRRVVAAVLLLVAAKLAAVAVPLLLKAIVDTLSRPEALVQVPLALLAGYALMRFATTVFTELRDLVFARVTMSTVADFTLRVFRHLHALSARFHMQRATGALTRDVERGTAGIGFLLGVGLFTIVPTLVEITVVLAILTANYRLTFTWILLATFLAYVVFTVVFTRQRAIHQRALNELDSNANRRLVDSLLNYETVKHYAGERFEAQRFQDIMGGWIEAGVRNQKALTRLHLWQSAAIAAGVAAVMVTAGRRVVGGSMTVGDLVLINAYVIQVCLPLNSLGFVFREASDALVKAERLFELLAQKPDVPQDDEGPGLDVGAGEVRFEHVSFGYEASRQVLWDVDLAIPAGHTVAVVGGSGSGKSTLARLLLRFYEPASGRITIDGRDIREAAPGSLREAIGIVPQDTSLFNDTIAYNIGYGRLGATMDEIVAAARGANVHDFIQALPEGYDTVVGERGLKLSGGEKQRIAIARAILKNPPILIFDEATSALDTRSERAIQEELERLSRSRTTLVIAHRLSTVVNADEIVVLEQGRIVERGRHEALLAANGLYAQMWALQQQQSELQKAERRALMRPVNLATLVAEAVDGLRPEMDARGIHLYMTVTTDAARVSGEPGVLQQVVWDLLGHAVQVSRMGDRVEVRLDRVGGEARLAVSDLKAPPLIAVGESDRESGERIPGTNHAFDPAALRARIEEHGGRLTVEAGREGGAIYTMALPLRAVQSAEARPPGPAQEHAQSLSLEGRHVLVVDDHEDTREILTAIIGARGARVTTLGAGSAVLDHLRDTQPWPDLLVCDIGLPDIDGFSVLRRIRALEAQRGIALDKRMPAVALTGYADSEDRTRALLAGFQVHLGKPVDPNELLTHIAVLLRAQPPSVRQHAN